jgi:trimethylamine:corrinoid methyltransferase-like protein
MTTSILDGAHPALSAYRTEKVIVVAVVPEDGDAFPALRTGASCDAPVQLAAIAWSGAPSSSTAAIALATANAVALAGPYRAW